MQLFILLLLCTLKKLIFARLIFVDFRGFFGKSAKNLILRSAKLNSYVELEFLQTHMSVYVELVSVLKTIVLLL